MRKTFSDWGKRVYETLKYEPNPEKLVQIYCLSWNEKKLIMKNPEYLDEDNFRLQIGKMQKNWETIYNEITLWLWIEYMIKHTKKWHHSIIQIWSDVWECLQPWTENWVLTAKEEKEYIEKFIKKKFGKKWEVIKVEIWSKKYPEVFEAIRNWKEWITPKVEPTLESSFTSPLQIIQYLAYHANKNKDLMELFYRTKPAKYLWQDVQNKVKPWDSDADFYGIVEVWLRLYEVLNWISIQWWLWRQRVYDKIISLIINWEDKIEKEKEFDCDYKLSFYEKGKWYDDNIKYPALKKLHDFCKDKYPNTKFNPLYINLYGWDNGSINEVKEKMNEKSKLTSKLKTRGYSLLIAAALWWTTWYITYDIIKDKEQQKQEKYEKERIEMDKQYRNKIREPQLDCFYIDESFPDFVEEQSNILMAEYDISNINKEINCWDFSIISNDIIDMYRDAADIRSSELHKKLPLISKLDLEKLTEEEYKDLFWDLDAEEFARIHWWEIIDKHHLPYQDEPYKHFNQYKDIIENTLKYWNIDISRYKTKEIPTKSLSYFIKDKWQLRWFYSLKCIEVDLGNWKKIKMFVAKKNMRYREKYDELWDYTPKDWYQCMFNLTKNYPYVMNEKTDSN